MKFLFTFILLSISMAVLCQSQKKSITGKYTDETTTLELKADSSFILTTPDFVFPSSTATFTTTGKWKDSARLVILNPGKEKRIPEIKLTERSIAGTDSIHIKINSFTQTFHDELLSNTTAYPFEILMLYVNSHKNYRNLVHKPIRRVCSFAPRIKHQQIIDSSNSIQLPGQQIKQLGIYIYGMDKPVFLQPQNKASNYFEIRIILPLDADRMPRSKKVMIKRKKAFFYEYRGKLRRILNPLRKIK